MKSKSPFPKKSPLSLQVYQGDKYESPDTIITKTVGEQVGKAMMGIADNAVDYMNTEGKIANNKQPEPSKSVNSIGLGGEKHEGFGLEDRYTDTLPETPNVNTNLTKGGFGRFTDKDSKAIVPNLVDLGRIGRKNRGIATKNGKKVLRLPTDNNGDVEKGSLGVSGTVAMMKGSPNKLIGDTMDPNQPQALENRDFRFNQDSIAPGRLGSASSVNTQNQIFPGGQAQIAAEQLQTPLYDKGHGTKQAHEHPTKTTTKMKPDGEYPGAKYVKGDYTNQENLQAKGLDIHIATLVQSDKKGAYIKEKPDTGPKSKIQTAKGFGKKIRLNDMARPSFTPNEGDQLDPHNFLFQKTPKKSK